jgi:hypothetical protein
MNGTSVPVSIGKMLLVSSQTGRGFNMNGTSVPVSIGKMLLVSPSSLTMYQLAKSAHRFDISVEVCTKPLTALTLVNRQKFDAVCDLT